ncbi:MAG: hypothetical protein ACXABY_16100, partial [Candidatus Thorarchaeota archaeon]
MAKSLNYGGTVFFNQGSSISMTDFALLHKKARHDIRMCLQAWIEILHDELGERIDYVYSKGSSMKNWDSPIDYVPVLSDVDI